MCSCYFDLDGLDNNVDDDDESGIESYLINQTKKTNRKCLCRTLLF